MAGIAPTIPAATTEPGLNTPAHEWASKTTSMLSPDSTNTAQTVNPTTKDLLASSPDRSSAPPAQPTLSSTSVASTPGLDVPGAYPHERSSVGNVDLRGAANSVSQSMHDAAQSLGETAAQYLPQAAQYLPKSVVDTVAGYMPTVQSNDHVQASTHDTSHQKSLPTTELAGHASGEHVSGVGALPGSVAESGVARLPDDRTPTATPPAGGVNTSLAAASGVLGGVTEKAKAYVPSSLTGQNKELPTTESPSISHNTGVGSLPGPNSESNVALLPDEKFAKQSTNATSASTGTRRVATSGVSKPSTEIDESLDRGAGAVGGVGSLPGRGNESGVARLPDERTPPKPDPEGIPKSSIAAANQGGFVSAVPLSFGTGAHVTSTSSAAPLPLGTDARVSQTPSTHVPLAPSTLPSATSGKESGGSLTGGLKGESTGVGRTVDEREKPLDVGSQGKQGSKGTPRELQDHKDKRDDPTTPSPPSPHHHQQEGDDPPCTAEKAKENGHGELLANLRQPTTEARKHALGSHGAQWFGVGLNEDPPLDKDDKGTGSGYDTDYHPAELHPLEPGHSQKTNQTAIGEDERTSKGASEAQKHRDEQEHANGGGGGGGHDDSNGGEGRKKVGFMEKMKGEAKVLFGKVERGEKGEAKVEEGRRMKAGESQVPAGNGH